MRKAILRKAILRKAIMRQYLFVLIPVIYFIIAAPRADADVNEVLNFTNYTHEELYVELIVSDHCCSHSYDLYVWPDETSIAYYWAHSVHATYSACAYGEMSGYFYGCLSGGISDHNNNIYFDHTGDPYLANPSYLPAEVYVFDNPYAEPHHHPGRSSSHHHASVGCFMDTLSLR